MTELRVAQIVTTLARGGAQATVLSSRGMDDRGVAVTVLAGTDDTGEGTHWPDLDEAGGPVVAVPPLRRSIRPADDARALRWLTGWLRRHRPDVVHTHSTKAGVLGRLAARRVGIPVVHTVHGWGEAADGGARTPAVPRLLRSVERALAPAAHALVVVTPLDAGVGLDRGIGRPDQYRVIRSGVDLAPSRRAFADRAVIRQELDLGDRFVVGTVARLARQKDLSTLLAGFAAAGIDDGVLLVVGDGPLRDALQAEARALGLGAAVRWLGARPDGARLVAAFDAFALTSRWEGLPRALVEAQAARVPVVATPVGGVGELVEHERTGLVVPVGCPDAVAGALTEVAADPAGAARRAVAAAAALEPFEMERMRSDLAALWWEAADRAPSPRPPSVRPG
ncbi:MAG: glycosyltransferase [Actinomycetota bacterium]